jgi:hypothetical protein
MEFALEDCRRIRFLGTEIRIALSLVRWNTPFWILDQRAGKRQILKHTVTAKGTWNCTAHRTSAFAFAVKETYSVQYSDHFKWIYINSLYTSVISKGLANSAHDKQNHCRRRKEGRCKETNRRKSSSSLTALDNRSAKPVEEKIYRQITSEL